MITIPPRRRADPPPPRNTPRRSSLPRFAAPFAALLLATLAACNGTAVVTLTATPSTDTFLAYRVGLASVQLQTSSGGTSTNVLPTGTTVDLARLVDLSDVVGASSADTGTYTRAVVTLDYSAAQIVYDDGTPGGVMLTPLGANGQALGRVTLTLLLDPANQMGIAHASSTRLSLAFNLAASNVVNVTQKTVSVMPMMAASAIPIDSKTVRIRGPLGNADSSTFSTGVMPFDFATSEGGSLRITPTTGTAYEINGTPSSGAAGLTQLASLSSGTMTEAFGSLTTSTSTSSSPLAAGTTTTPTYTCSDGTTPQTVNGVYTCTDGATLENTTAASTGSTTTITTVSFSATQVLAGSSVQGSGLDRVSGIVTGRSGDTLTIDDGTLLTESGANSLIFGTTTVKIGPNTHVTEFGEGTADSNGIAQISVGSLVYAFGTASDVTSTGATLDASAGRARVSQTTASGLVTTQGTSGTTLTLNLAQLAGRSAAAFDFAGTSSAPGGDASPSSYVVSTGTADLANAAAGEPVQVTGWPAPFGSAPPDFSEASSFLDYTTINAELVLDWTGTSAPFSSYTTSQIDLDAQNTGIGTRHTIQIGAQTFNIIGLPYLYIVPSSAGTNTVFTIGHSVSRSFENFNTFSAFVTQLQAELTGSAVATGITAIGQYASSTYTFSASSITLLLDN